MPKPARKRRKSTDEGDGPGTKKNRPASGDGDKTFSEPTKSPPLNSSSDISLNHVGVTNTTNSTVHEAHNLTDAPSTSNQSILSSLAGPIRPSTATHPSPTIQPPTPTASNESFGKGAGLIHPYSVRDPPPGIHPPITTPRRGRKRHQRATTPPETYIDNLPLVSIVAPNPECPATGFRRGRAYYLINGVTRLTDTILESVDALLETEVLNRELDEAWNTTLERAVQGVAWRDLQGEPPAHIKEILRQRAAEEAREAEGGNAEAAASEELASGAEQSEGEEKEGGHVDHDDGEAVGGRVGGRSYVDATSPECVAGPLISMGVAAQTHDPVVVEEGTQAEQAGQQSGAQQQAGGQPGEQQQASGEQPGEQQQASGEQPGGSGQASGEAGAEPEAGTQPEAVTPPRLAPNVDPPRDLPGWVDYEARLVDPRFLMKDYEGH